MFSSNTQKQIIIFPSVFNTQNANRVLLLYTGSLFPWLVLYFCFTSMMLVFPLEKVRSALTCIRYVYDPKTIHSLLKLTTRALSTLTNLLEAFFKFKFKFKFICAPPTQDIQHTATNTMQSFVCDGHHVGFDYISLACRGESAQTEVRMDASDKWH